MGAPLTVSSCLVALGLVGDCLPASLPANISSRVSVPEGAGGLSLAEPQQCVSKGSWFPWQSPGRRLLGFPRQTVRVVAEGKRELRYQLTPGRQGGGAELLVRTLGSPSRRSMNEVLGLGTPTWVSTALSVCFYQDLRLPDLILY